MSKPKKKIFIDRKVVYLMSKLRIIVYKINFKKKLTGIENRTDQSG